jgi:hypothetical protein
VAALFSHVFCALFASCFVVLFVTHTHFELTPTSFQHLLAAAREIRCLAVRGNTSCASSLSMASQPRLPHGTHTRTLFTPPLKPILVGKMVHKWCTFGWHAHTHTPASLYCVPHATTSHPATHALMKTFPHSSSSFDTREIQVPLGWMRERSLDGCTTNEPTPNSTNHTTPAQPFWMVGNFDAIAILDCAYIALSSRQRKQ